MSIKQGGKYGVPSPGFGMSSRHSTAVRLLPPPEARFEILESIVGRSIAEPEDVVLLASGLSKGPTDCK